MHPGVAQVWRNRTDGFTHIRTEVPVAPSARRARASRPMPTEEGYLPGETDLVSLSSNMEELRRNFPTHAVVNSGYPEDEWAGFAD